MAAMARLAFTHPRTRQCSVRTKFFASLFPEYQAVQMKRCGAQGQAVQAQSLSIIRNRD